MFGLGAGVLGLNERGVFIMDHNSHDYKSFADSKIATKKFFARHRVSVPQLFGYYKTIDEVGDFSTFDPPFVIKPNKGFGGGGILVIEEKTDTGFLDIKGRFHSIASLKKHCQDIIAGYFSVSGGRDQVIIEQKIILDDHIAILGTYGLPDIRVIVYNKIPLVAMLRIPSKYSDGKANLHQGAYAAGIDLGTGEITHLFARNRHVQNLEGLGDLRGVIIPHWEEILELASQSQQLTGMPYIGCDIVLDRDHGPMLLEINARPGLQVQVVNRIRLAERLKKVADIHVDTYEKGVRLARDMFTKKTIENDIYKSRSVIGMREYVDVIFNDQKARTLAHIQPAKHRGSVSQSFFEYLMGSGKISDQVKGIIHIDDLTCVKLGIILDGIEMHGLFEVVEAQEASIILGYTMTSRFLICPDKYGDSLLPPSVSKHASVNAGIFINQQKQTRDIDEQIIGLDRKMPILNFLSPINTQEMMISFIQKKGKSPFTFRYNIERLPDLDAIDEQLEKIVIPEIPLKLIYAKKLEEVQLKSKLLRALANEQDGKVSKYSEMLYGSLQEDLLIRSKEVIDAGVEGEEISGNFLTLQEVQDTVIKFFRIYDMDIAISFVSNLVSRVSISKKEIKIREDIQVTKSDLRAIIAHEIETHYFRRYNGSMHDLRILEKGTAGYVATEEGLAIYHQSRYLQSGSTKQTSLYKMYYLLDFIQTHSYREVIDYLDHLYHGDLEKMFTVLLRLKRGICSVDSDNVFFKDGVYVTGLDTVEQFVVDGGNIRDLYVGKIRTDEVGMFKDAGYRYGQGLKLPLFVR